MEIVVAGAGAMGMLIGSYAAEAGHSVSFLTRRGDQAEALGSGGLVRIDNSAERRFRVRAFCSVQEAPAQALWIAAVKSGSLPTLLGRLETGEPPAYLLFIQNGVRHFENAGSLPFPSIGFASVTHGAMRLDDTTVQHLGSGGWDAAHWRGDASPLQALQRTMPEPFRIDLQPDAKTMLYRKVIVNCCVNPLTALLGVKNGGLLTRPGAHRLMGDVYSELAAAYPEIARLVPFEAVEAVCRTTAANESSMLTDRKQGRPMETDTIVTAAIGDRRGQMPVLGLLEQLLKAIDEREGEL